MATTDPSRLADAPPVSPSVVTSREVIGRTPWQLFWLRFKQDRAALVGAIFVSLLVVLALAAPLVAKIVGHGPNDINEKTGYVNSYGSPIVHPFGNVVLPAQTLPGVPTADNPNPAPRVIKATNDGPYLFGDDQLGRDVFVRVIYGIRTSLSVGIIATGLAVTIGVLLGMAAGFFRGWIDTVIARIIDIVLSMPLLVFGIGISEVCGISKEGCLGGFLKPGLPVVVFIIVLFSWTSVARIIRGNTLSIREREFVEAARSIGSSNSRIMFRDLLPNLIAPIIIYGSLLIPAAISFEAYLSFLGLGAPPGTASWGADIASANGYYQIAWWMMFFPGVALLLTTLAFNLLGDGLRDALDPKTGR